MQHDILNTEVTTIDGEKTTLAPWAGKVLLIVNVASKCGLTPQYEQLEALQKGLESEGFSVLGFPCNQFGQQEPGDAAEIASFCRLSHDVSFPMFAKIEVNGPGAHPLYRHLKQAAPGLLGTEAIKWNFTKFLLDAEHRVVRRFAPTDTPQSLEAHIEPLLPRPA